MRVLFLNYEYPPLGGGAGNATYYILKEFSKIPDLKVDLVTSSLNESKTENISENIAVHYLDIGKKGNLHFQTNFNLLAYSWKSYFYCKNLIKNEKFDLTLAFFGIPCGYIAMKLGLPYIVSLRGSDVPFYNERFKWPDKLVFRRLSRVIWRKAQYVIALSNDLIQLARNTTKTQKISVIYNGINIKEFYPDVEKNKQEKSFNILFIGRLIERKGLIYLLEALQQITAEYPQTKLLVAGDGPMKMEYENYVKNNGLSGKVEFLGIVKHDYIAELYRRAHVFVLPSLNEALGNVTQEALASGLPIVTTKTGAAELIDDNGFIIAKKSAKEIAEALRKIIEDENLRKKFSARSRELAENMSWENTAKKYYELFESAKLNGK